MKMKDEKRKKNDYVYMESVIENNRKENGGES